MTCQPLKTSRMLKRDVRARNGLVLDCINPISLLCGRLARAPVYHTAELVAENARLRDALKLRDNDCAQHARSIGELRRIRLQLENQLAAAKCDLLLQEVPPYPTSIPVNTQGKDALYWHQTCRTLQQHNTALRKELERLKTASQDTGNSQDTKWPAACSST
jgi:hypothetical protein